VRAPRRRDRPGGTREAFRTTAKVAALPPARVAEQIQQAELTGARQPARSIQSAWRTSQFMALRPDAPSAKMRHMMVHYLVRIDGTERWDEWGDDWKAHTKVMGELRHVRDWLGPPNWVRDGRQSFQLDWGTALWEMTGEEARRLAAVKSNPMLRQIDDDDRVAVVWVECY
jgi:hypothetical protein